MATLTIDFDPRGQHKSLSLTPYRIKFPFPMWGLRYFTPERFSPVGLLWPQMVETYILMSAVLGTGNWHVPCKSRGRNL
jgi:hypothetical protein